MDSMKNVSLRQLLADYLIADEQLAKLETGTHDWLKLNKVRTTISSQLDALIDLEVAEANKNINE